MKTKNSRKISFRRMLLKYMVFVSVVPILVLGTFSAFNVYRTIQNNTDKMMDANLTQIGNSINTTINAYEDLEYQIYTNDDVVAWCEMIDAGKDVPATVNQMRRYIRGLLNTKDYIRAITIVTDGGYVVTYDTMNWFSNESSWIENFSKDFNEIYDEVTADYKKKIYSTEYATTFANDDYYLFHLAHRIVNYKNLEEKVGMVIVSLDEKLLQSSYDTESDSTGRDTYIIDSEGRIISSKYRQSLIGDKVNRNISSKRAQEKEYINASSIHGRWVNVYVSTNELRDWTVVSVIDDANLKLTVFLQTLYTAGIAFVILLLAFVSSLSISRRLNSDIERLSSGMGRAKEGDLNTRIDINEDTPEEIETMANAYNDMIDKLRESTEKERIATKKQQDAHIVALEAQINPHFLYNTLDTINWMAIEKEEFDISNAINALATILRYAIAKSNALVTVREEIEWLKKFIFLQQFRLKDAVSCELDVDPDIMDASIHKLLMQPFIENAIIHGFEDSTENATLWISLKNEDNHIVIRIKDNGKGMSPEMVDQINKGVIEAKDRTHIGMGNVITRMKMYYADDASVSVESTMDVGTIVTLKVPYNKE